MKKSTTLVQALCAPYCKYFKQDRNEELLCRSAVVVERLIDAGVFVPGREFAQNASAPDTQETLIRRVCAACDFRENDCDFSQDRRANPCGGFTLLCWLLEAGLVSENDL